jgi:hypothetical protein
LEIGGRVEALAQDAQLMATGREVLRLVGASTTFIDGKLVKRPEPEDMMGSQDIPENSWSTGLTVTIALLGL